ITLQKPCRKQRGPTGHEAAQFFDTIHAYRSSRSKLMSRRTNRRRFLKTSAVIGAGYWALGGIAPRESRAANEKIQFACVGVAGKGAEDSQDAGKNGDVVAICDVDDDRRKAAAVRWPDAQQFFDYREMFAKLGDKIDAFTV